MIVSDSIGPHRVEVVGLIGIKIVSLVLAHEIASFYILTPTKLIIEPAPTAIKVQHASAKFYGFRELNKIGKPVSGIPTIHFNRLVFHLVQVVSLSPYFSIKKEYCSLFFKKNL
jgi:hypothetical protein